MSIIFSLIDQLMDISAWFRKLGRADLNILSVERRRLFTFKTIHIYMLTLGRGGQTAVAQLLATQSDLLGSHRWPSAFRSFAVGHKIT